jgi:hypothetical protein
MFTGFQKAAGDIPPIPIRFYGPLYQQQPAFIKQQHAGAGFGILEKDKVAMSAYQPQLSVNKTVFQWVAAFGAKGVAHKDVSKL